MPFFGFNNEKSTTREWCTESLSEDYSSRLLRGKIGRCTFVASQNHAVLTKSFLDQIAFIVLALAVDDLHSTNMNTFQHLNIFSPKKGPSGLPELLFEHPQQLLALSGSPCLPPDYLDPCTFTIQSPSFHPSGLTHLIAAGLTLWAGSTPCPQPTTSYLLFLFPIA